MIGMRARMGSEEVEEADKEDVVRAHCITGGIMK
jgi:hypothetical protein